MLTSKLSVPVAGSRRLFLSGAGKAALSATAVALIAGCESMAESRMTAKASGTPSADAAILNVALGLEHEAIAAYQFGAESGLLQQPVLDVAVLFQAHHKQHRDALAAAINRLGGNPVEAKSVADYARSLEADTLKSQVDVLRLAHDLEEGAANAYLSVIPSFSDPALSQVAGRVAADETMHWTVLTRALGEPLPRDALTFGA